MLDVDSGTLSPLPGYLHRGLLAVATLGLLSFVCSSVLFLYLTFRLVSWRRKPGVKAPPINQFLFLVYNLLLAGKKEFRGSSKQAANKSADIQQGIGFCLNITALKNNAIQVGTSMCFAQGWLLSTGDLSSSLFICAIAIHTYFGVVRDYKLPSVPFYFCIAAIWTFTYTMALVGPLIHTHDFYVRASAWVFSPQLSPEVHADNHSAGLMTPTRPTGSGFTISGSSSAYSAPLPSTPSSSSP